MHKWEKGTADGVSTLALKPVCRINWSPKKSMPMVPENGDLSLQKHLEKKKDIK